MTKQLSKTERSKLMARVRSKGTAVEVAFAGAMREAGFAFEENVQELPGKPDIVLSESQIAIFLDGDLWHGGQWRRRGLTSLEEQFRNRDNRDYWISKVRGNIRRDIEKTDALRRAGWTVLRFWESDVKADVRDCVNVVAKAARRSRWSARERRGLSLSVAEFFAGIGLMRMGLEKAGWTVEFANDNDALKQEMYRGHFGNGEDLDTRRVEEVAAQDVPSVTLATASFPCTDLSLAGARGGINGGQSKAVWSFLDLLEEMGVRRPPLVLLENVTGFVHSHGGTDLRSCLNRLAELGYSLDAFFVDARSFVPQSRPRMFIVGVDTGLLSRTGSLPTTEELPSRLRPKLLSDFIKKNQDLPWAMRALPAPPDDAGRIGTILADVPISSREWWSKERTEYLLGQMSERHLAVVSRMMTRRRWQSGTVFRRMRNGKSTAELRYDGLAGCLRTPKGGSARQILLQAANGQCRVRLLNPRECARLMGADDYQIAPTLSANQCLFGFGDAVCVPAVTWIAEHYLTPTIAELIRGGPLPPVGGA